MRTGSSRSRNVYAALAALLAALVSAGAGPSHAGSSKTFTISRVGVNHSSHNDTSPPLKDLVAHAPKGKKIAPWDPRALLGTEIDNGEDEDYALTTGPGNANDPVVQRSQGTGRTPSPLLTFEGINNQDNQNTYGTRFAPPDNNGDVGPNHYVETVNLLFAIYDKAGNRLLGPAKMSTVFSGFGGTCSTRDDGDPVVQYDQLADRWVLTQFTTVSPYHECVAVSQTPDPLGSYHRYQFDYTKFPDYPKLGVWPDGYYASYNLFNPGLVGRGASAFDRAKMLNGDPADQIYFEIGASGTSSILPSDVDGAIPPAPGAPNAFFMRLDDAVEGGSTDRLVPFDFHADFDTPENSTFDQGADIPVAAFDSNMCGFSRACIPQPGTTNRVDALSNRLMYRIAYRNFGLYQQWLGSMTVDVGGDHAGVRWFELRSSGGGPLSVFQEGSFAPDASHRWMGSVAADIAGNIAVGYSVSSSTLAPSIRYATRSPSDPLGTLQTESTLYAGIGSEVGGANRWGDYTSMMVDPDGCTFWYVNEYIAATGNFTWNTRIGSFKVPTCTAALVTAKAAFFSPARGGQLDGYFVSFQNPTNVPITLTSIVDTLPPGFTYVPGSTVGNPTTADPSISGQTLTWPVSVTLGPGEFTRIVFSVIVSMTPGVYYNTAGGTASDGVVLSTGATAPVEVTPRV